MFYKPWCFPLYYISTFAIHLYLVAYFKSFVLIFTSWFGMLLESFLVTFLHHWRTSIRTFGFNMKKTIISQVELLIELCTFIDVLNWYYSCACFGYLYDCNDFVDLFYSSPVFSILLFGAVCPFWSISLFLYGQKSWNNSGK